jgi:hypothetical protein
VDSVEAEDDMDKDILAKYRTKQAITKIPKEYY